MRALWLIAPAALALVLRVVAVSGFSVIPFSDETGYLADGLLLLEGLAPGYKHVPNALMNWIVAACAGMQTAVAWVDRAVDPALAPLARPLLAMERALFVDYADLNGLRLVVIAVQTAAGTLAAAAVAWRGYIIAGAAGAVVAGALAMATPMFVELTAQTRSYSLAWSIGMLAFAALAISRRPLRHALVGALMGLAIATRVEMGLALIPLLLEVLHREERGRRWPAFATCLGVAIVVFLAAAPWYITSLAGNFRQIISVRLLSPAGAGESGFNAARELIVIGVGLPLVASIVALLATPPGHGRLYGVGIGLWMALLAALSMQPSLHGLRHEGALVLMTAAMVPMAVARFQAWAPGTTARHTVGIVAVLVGLHVTWAGARAAWNSRQSAVDGDPVAWLEANVPEGSRVYWVDGFKVPLPTTEAADALWDAAANPDGWRIKYRRAAQRLALGDRLPRAMSEDPLQLERAVFRRWFILGAEVGPHRRRFDVRLVSEGTPFATSPTEAIDALCEKGGAYAYYGIPISRLGKPSMMWAPPNGVPHAMIIYFFEHRENGQPKRC